MEATAIETTEIPVSPSASRVRKILQTAGWVSLALFSLVAFTIFKLPEARLKNLIQGHIASALSSQGIAFTTGSTSLSIGFGITYQMKDVVLTAPQSEQPIRIDQIEIHPSLSSLLLGKFGGSFFLAQGDGNLKGSFSYKKSGGGEISASAQANNINPGKLGILAIAAGIRGSMLINGDTSVSGALETPASWTGVMKLNLSKISLDQQSISGFSVPKISVSEGKVDVNIEQGKVLVKNLSLGKPGHAADDIVATATGDILMGKQWDSSTMNLKTRLTLSQTILKSFVLLDAILGAGKQPDGSYAYNLSGSVTAPIPTPVGTQ